MNEKHEAVIWKIQSVLFFSPQYWFDKWCHFWIHKKKMKQRTWMELDPILSKSCQVASSFISQYLSTSKFSFLLIKMTKTERKRCSLHSLTTPLPLHWRKRCYMRSYCSKEQNLVQNKCLIVVVIIGIGNLEKNLSGTLIMYIFILWFFTPVAIWN